MRADRLIQVLLHLQSRPRVTAAELAAALEVSVATARRDLEALSAAGVPVYPQRGRGGGWSLLGGARTDLSGLTAPEARALFLLAGPATAADGEASSALRKLVRALPTPFRAEAEAAAVATVVDDQRWGAAARQRAPHLDALREAVVRRRRVRLRYTGATGRTSDRVVDAWGVVDKDGTWYLVAGTERGPRTYRVDRIAEAEVTGEPAEVPADLDLAAVWAQVVEEVEALRSTVWATVRVPERHVGVLRAQFGRHVEVEVVAGDGMADDGVARVRVGAPTPLDVARHLAGWGDGIVVEGPPEVRAELARIGAELVSRYVGTR
ncbi:WYL domain-containing protein [Isoptericola sp. S6320L]|uniref:helix-turn-helix transcriptional regulator n=1 Tax=Isoptericola sp. S6320L TaxID=2926411 RepID=UPI001FF2F9F3|nr:WYL domain-containing protein [Isoptericola sp. S6320L]MCK0118624.1 WYL domain-containing protein [Isoptericola sp. S6320L]